MAGGFGKGVIWGGLTSIMAVSVASVVAQGPQPPVVAASAPVTEAAPEPIVTNPAKPRSDRSPVTGQDAPKAPAPQPDTLAAVRDDTVQSAAQPETGAAAQLTGPAVESATGGLNAAPGETRTPAARHPSSGLAAPPAEPSVSISTGPAPSDPSPVLEGLAQSEDPVQSAAPDASSAAAVPGSIESSISVDPEQPPLPEVPTETRAFETALPGDAARSTPGTAQEAPAPQPSRTAAASPGTNMPATAETDGPTPAQVAMPDDAEETPELATEDILAGIGAPPARSGGLAPDVQINRLPTLGDDRADIPRQLGPSAPDADETAQSDRPVDRFAAPFDGLDGRPAMAIVLMDDGVDLTRQTVGLPALRSFPYPISFAVDSTLPDARERMAAYRAAGFEVLATLNLPQGARAQDAEVSLSVALDTLPEAIGVLEGVDEGVQGSRETALHVAEILAQTGHGFVTQNRGLNTVQKLAARAGVPTAVVFRDFDDQGQSPAVMRRFLDQAAFRAARDGTVVMLGRLREDTISALLVWGLQDRAARVKLVPVSAALSAP